ncbi:hypothetical protein [Streptomyces sp. HPF1205]|uniref:hypothetical protein n=1 Tax=Streptomyces sp. HPF1205 TaxID=2873262 RepID=UPI001CEC2931|nr:hypothetical protein [Streptomyces sp. HPF1205]
MHAAAWAGPLPRSALTASVALCGACSMIRYRASRSSSSAISLSYLPCSLMDHETRACVNS